MMRVVLDTNVLVSGTFWSRQSSRIITLIGQKAVKLVLSRSILEEYNRVMNYEEIRAKVQHHHERSEVVQKILLLAEVITPTEHFEVIKEDPDDDKFIDAAVAGHAHYIISQDKHLLALKEFRGIKIITPEEFLALFKLSD